MAILVGQLIEILKQFDPDREVVIHTLKGENVEVNGYFIQKDQDNHSFYLTDFDYHINREWTTTLIKDFDGEINYYVDDEDDAHIIGVGNVNFFTTQTGF